MEIVLPRETHAAVNLNSAIADGPASIARVHFGDRDRNGSVVSIFFERPCGVISCRAGTFSFEIHVRALMLYGLEHSNRLAELLSHFCVVHGNLERALHAPYHFGNQGSRGNVER